MELEELLASRTPALLRTAYLLTGDPESARDLLQTALLRVHPRVDRLREPGALEAYVRKTMMTTAATSRRRRWHGERPTAQLPEAPTSDVDSAVRLDLLTALRALPPDQRAVLVCRFYEDLSEAQTADLLGIAPGTVKSRTSRALTALRTSGFTLDGSTS